ncbi:MAG: flippase-like domain-containing protein [Roseiarcus sp.]|jgi:uncharacterized protein (TIRG00374 family)
MNPAPASRFGASSAKGERSAPTFDWRGSAPRVAITGVLIALVAWRLDFRALSARLGALDTTWTALAFLVVFAAIAVSAWKWGLILRARAHPLPYGRLLRHYLVGLFFNNVLPTTVGGDAVRAWETSKDTGEISEAVGSVVTERLIAGAALGVTALLGLPFVADAGRLVFQVLLFLAIDLALVALFVVPKVADGVVTKLLPPRFAGLREGVSGTVATVRATLKSPSLFARVMLLSILFQVLVAAVNACIFRAIGTPVTMAQCVIYTPMIFTVTMLPISLSGLGVREAAYWYFFSQIGVGQAEAVAASLAFFVIVGISSLPGAPLFIWNHRDDAETRSLQTPAERPIPQPSSRNAMQQRSIRLSLAAAASQAIDGPRETWKRMVNRLRGVADISPRSAQELIEKQRALVLDVREQNEFDAWRLPNSLHIPLGALDARAAELEASKDRPIVVICHGGKRSATACHRLAKRGLAQTYNIAGGILAWNKANLPIVKGTA